MNISVTICTNGTAIDLAFVERARSAKILAIQIGLDGASFEAHERLRGAGTFERTWQGIELARTHGLPVELLCTVTRPTKDEYLKVVKFARKHGLQVALNEYLPLGPTRAARAELELTTEQLFQLRSSVATLSLAGVLPQRADEAQSFNRSAKGNSTRPLLEFDKVQNCLGREGGGHILPSGDVLVCPMLDWPEMVGGNVRQTPLREIWERSPTFEQLRQLSVDGYATCQTCANRYLCGGTCRAITMAEKGCLAGPPDLARCLWQQTWYDWLARVEFDSVEPLQLIAERNGLFR
jgi:radical SAM protein with 4Fe4S-binding SPASM domain